jgi:hypothetical protein
MRLIETYKVETPYIRMKDGGEVGVLYRVIPSNKRGIPHDYDGEILLRVFNAWVSLSNPQHTWEVPYNHAELTLERLPSGASIILEQD